MDQESKQYIRVERIIALKRYEQPPPGYFHLLPGRIINRIEQGEGQSGFWEKRLPAFRIRPAMAYALGLSVCGALAAGIYIPLNVDQTADSGENTAGQQWAVTTSAASALRDVHLVGSGSTDPVTPPRTGDTFFLSSEARAMPVSLFTDN